MKCPFCGQENSYLSLNCTSCFAYIYPEEKEAAKLIKPEDTRKYNPLSILSFILGIIGIMVCLCYPMSIINSIIAIILGIMARKKILKDGKKQKGERLALWSIICGSLALLGSISIAIVDYMWKITSLYGK